MRIDIDRIAVVDHQVRPKVTRSVARAPQRVALLTGYGGFVNAPVMEFAAPLIAAIADVMARVSSEPVVATVLVAMTEDEWLRRACLLLAALAIDAVIGDPRWLWCVVPHPVVWAGKLTGLLDRWLNKGGQAPAIRWTAGLVTVIVVCGLAGALGALVAAVSAELPWGWIAELLLVAVLVAQRDLFGHVRRVRKALSSGGVTAGRDAVAHIVGRDPQSLDQHGVARAAIETLAENFSDGVVAPALFYLVFGPIGIAVYKALNTMDSMIGHRNLRYEWFGKTAARLDDVANLIPARLSALLLVLGSVIAPTANPFRAIVVVLRDARKHRSWNAGWPEAAMAGALGLALAGPRKYGAEMARDPWIGDGRARAEPRDISRALLLFSLACMIQAMALVLLIAWRAAVQ